MISVSTDSTRARCREDVRSRIWRFVEDRRMFPSAILITEANCLTVVKRRYLLRAGHADTSSCSVVLDVSLSFHRDLGACPRSLSEEYIVLYDH